MSEAIDSMELEAIRARILQEKDVKVLHGLERLACGRFAYVIETPFMTFPKFAVGTTDLHNTDVRQVLACGALWSAQDAFEMICRPGGAER